MSKLDKMIRDINEDGYQDGGFGAGHPASIEKWKNEFKEMIQEILDDTFDKDDTKAYEFWQKVKKL